MNHLGRKTALAGICLLVWGAIAPAEAFPGRCLLTVDGKTYLKGICRIDVSADGSFSIAAGLRLKSRHFAYVSLDGTSGKAQGYWNGVEAEKHAHDDLGTLTKQGGCWTNERARICAFR